MSTCAPWLTHFHLSAPPFAKDLDDADLWLPSARERVVDALVQGVGERQHAILTGEPGVGKTCALRALRHKLPDTGYRLTYCHNATLGRRDFYRQLCLAMGLQAKATAAGVFYAVSRHVQELGRDSVHPVFLLDEAQLLHQDVLDHLHVLANYQWDRKPLLSILLVGLPDLEDRMRLRRNRSLWSRIHCRHHLGEAEPADTAEYLEHRLLQVGSSAGQLFDSDAVVMIHEASLGRLRDIDRLATQTLKSACRLGLSRIDAALVQSVAQAHA
jgi:general secretion pathway protein A